MNRSRLNKSRGNVRRWQVVAVVGVAVTIAGIGLGVASAAEAAPTVNCPQVNVNVAIPAQAQNEVKQNLALLQTQIDEANKRLASSVGQGGKDFIQNAILGPLKDKRFSTINRIETAIGRNAAKPNLNAEGLSTCTLNGAATGGNTGNNNGNNNGGGATAAPVATAVPAPTWAS